MSTITKFKRVAQSISVTLIIGLGALVYSASQASAGRIFYLLTIMVLALLVLIICQSYLEYKKRTYDPTLVLRYQDIFDDLIPARRTAAKAILDKQDNAILDKQDEQDLVNIEEVLDFFEDLGFYLEAEQFTAEVLHHHFYHWIRVYLDPKVVNAYVDKERNLQPARWDHLELLLTAVAKIEITKESKVKALAELRFPENDLKKYLAEERDMEE